MNWMGPLISRRLVPTGNRSAITRCRPVPLRLRCTGYTAVAVLLLSTTTVAQSITNGASGGHGFAGVGALASTDDAAERVRFYNASAAGTAWLVEAAVFVAPRIAAGVEALALGTVTGSTAELCCLERVEEQEAAILATGRWRALHQNRLGIDAVFGIGAVNQHRDTRTSLRFVPNSETSTIDDRHFPVVGVGVDVPFSVIPHVAISPLIRVYFLDRSGQDMASVPSTSSTRVAVGVTAGVAW